MWDRQEKGSNSECNLWATEAQSTWGSLKDSSEHTWDSPPSQRARKLGYLSPAPTSHGLWAAPGRYLTPALPACSLQWLSLLSDKLEDAGSGGIWMVNAKRMWVGHWQHLHPRLSRLYSSNLSLNVISSGKVSLIPIVWRRRSFTWFSHHALSRHFPDHIMNVPVFSSNYKLL